MAVAEPGQFGAGIDGLSTDEVLRLRRVAGERAPASPATRSYLRIFVELAFPAANLALAAVSVVLLSLGLVIDALLTAGLVVGNVAVGMFQEVRAKRQLDRIAVLARSDAIVRRGGQEVAVDPAEVVEGDIVLVRTGDQVQVDGTLLAADRCAVDESLLTGESDLVTKRAGDQIYSGSFCMTGRALYRCDEDGMAGLANRIAAQARAARVVRTPLQREVGIVLWAMVVLVMLLSVQVIRSFHDLYGTPPLVETTRAAAVIVALIPQGLWVMVTVTYALAIVRIAPRGTLVQRLNAVESMSHVDILCLDKTGTITTNALIVEGLHPVAGDEAGLRAAYAAYCASVSIGNRSTEAIAAALGGQPLPVKEEVQFDSARKWSAVAFDTRELRGLYVLGAPDALAARTPSHQERAVSAWTQQGLRVLLLARADGVAPVAYEDGEPVLPDALNALGYVVLRDELRPAARETIRAFLDLGVHLKVISGDHPETVSALAREAGIPGAERHVSGTQLAGYDDDEFAAAVREQTVFGRIAPEQKAEIVAQLRADDRYVAMIGDGVNDVPAMKRAHLAIAMRAGTAVTRGIADMILLDDSFAALPAAFSEGRRIRAGMATVVRLFLARTVAVMLIIFAAALATSEFPLTPRHTALQSALTVGIPAFFIATWTRPTETGKYLIPPALRFVIPAGITLAVAGAAVYEIALRLTDVETSRTILALVTVFAGALLIPFVDDAPREWMTLHGLVSPGRTAILAGAMLVTALAAAFTPIRDFYELERLGFGGWGTVMLTVTLWAAALAAVWRGLDALFARAPRQWQAAPPLAGSDERSAPADAPAAGER